MTRLSHYIIAFIIAVGVKAVFGWAIFNVVPVHRNSVTVNTPEYATEVRQALSPLGIPDLKITEREPVKHTFLLSVFVSAYSVASTLVLFFGALWVMRRSSFKPDRSNPSQERTAERPFE